MTFFQRDIVLVHFPFTDLSSTKLRPALIISSSTIKRTGDFICVQITSQSHGDVTYIPLLPEMVETTLPLTIGLRVHKIFCLNEKLIVHKVSAMRPDAFRQLLERIEKVVLGVDK